MMLHAAALHIGFGKIWLFCNHFIVVRQRLVPLRLLFIERAKMEHRIATERIKIENFAIFRLSLFSCSRCRKGIGVQDVHIFIASCRFNKCSRVLQGFSPLPHLP